MTYQQKNAAVSLFSMVLVFAIYSVKIALLYQAGRFEAADGMSVLGQSVLLLIAASIIVTVLASLAFNIVQAIVTTTPPPSFVVDERDRAIELRGLRTSVYVTGGGFCLAMIALALDQPVFWVLNLIVFSFALGVITDNLLKLNLYRKGL